MSCNALSGVSGHEILTERITVRGAVQGVGFRPFVYNIACSLGLKGTVCNTWDGVEIIIQGNPDLLSRFREILCEKPPALARINEISVEQLCSGPFDGFTIKASSDGQSRNTIVPPDASICGSCRAEMENPEDRRFLYPFINCTHCGPRFTILKDLPFDRRNTTMEPFAMCSDCLAEYVNPENRRFHAQANCCPVCGPQVFLVDGDGFSVSGHLAIEKAAAMLEKGMIIAVKGIGGFHLAVDAANDSAVSRLRNLKARGDKPFAVMASSIMHVRRFAEVDSCEESVLMSPQRPVVILRKKKEGECSVKISDYVAPGNPVTGVMLPYTPLHVLLFRGKDGVLVMTSANRKDNPVIRENIDALDLTGLMADAVLFNDREIHSRCDDSVGRFMEGSFRLFRRSRGYAPMPVDIGKDAPDILATGGIMKNTFCVVKGRSAFLSQHIGDIETPAGLGFFYETSARMCRMYGINPSIIVQDMHPDHITSGCGKFFPDAELISVQHHHAHIASCMLENGYDGDVIGFAFDGTGYGDDGTVWGGEILVASAEKYERAAHICKVPMPGGAAAVREPWRMGISWLYQTFGEEIWALDLPVFRSFKDLFDSSDIRAIVHIMNRKVNSPLTSSMGRLFDAVAAIIGLCAVNTFDGQAATALEMCAIDTPADLFCDTSGHCIDIAGQMQKMGKSGVFEIDMRPLIRMIVSDLKSGVDNTVICTRFHNVIIRTFADIGEYLAEHTGIRVAALSGGVFQNARLLSGLSSALSEKGLKVLTHSLVPSNDGGLSLGQAAIAAALYRKRVKT